MESKNEVCFSNFSKEVHSVNNLMSRLNTMNTRKILRMFGKKKTNRGMIGASILGLGLTGATVYGLMKKRNIDTSHEMKGIENLIGSLNIGRNGQMPNMASLAEFSQELLPNKTEHNQNNDTPKE